MVNDRLIDGNFPAIISIKKLDNLASVLRAIILRGTVSLILALRSQFNYGNVCQSIFGM
jgi:hypothetical protein